MHLYLDCKQTAVSYFQMQTMWSNYAVWHSAKMYKFSASDILHDLSNSEEKEKKLNNFLGNEFAKRN